MLVAGLYVDRDLVYVVRNPIGMHRPPAVGAFIPQRHINYFAHYLTDVGLRRLAQSEIPVVA